MKSDLEFLDENRQLVALPGFAFIDELGFCIQIIYGEKKKELLSKYLNENTYL